MSLVSVLMPTYDQSRFIARAIDSLLVQRLADWELIVVDDGSPDDTADVVKPYLDDPRIRYERLPENRGLGAALNHGLGLAAGRFVAYLPSDDVWYADHLATLLAALETEDGAVLAHSGVRHHYNRSATGAVPGYPLQLVQVMHRAGPERWTERDELVTDDLDRMFWSKLSGAMVGTGQVTCEWVDHPAQLHKVIREPEGGINPYRVRFEVADPLRFHSTVGNRIDEVEHYRRFRERPDTPPVADGLKILLVGELAYNAERVLALEERGHRLYGLWMEDPYWYNTVGPLPFGHVQDLPREGWREAVAEIRPDVVYALLNWQAVPFAHRVMSALADVPFVWHFKEGPFICMEQGMWPQLVDLYRLSDGQIYSSPEMQDWFETVVPGLAAGRSPAMVLDGDLPKRDWLTPERSPRLSDADGELHTVVPGRPIGLHPPDVARLADAGVHLHFYGDFTHGQWREWIERSRSLAPDHLHLHAQVDQGRWVEEFSQYDAGWLHFFESENGGELRRANWDDLNYPARLATLAVAGLPVLQRDNRDSIVATQTLVRERDLGLLFSDMDELGDLLRDRPRMDALRDNVWRHREEFTFDFHADRLLAFLRHVVAERPRRSGR
jgi:glycosyltransferase involved in cell wall biosynthesis